MSWLSDQRHAGVPGWRRTTTGAAIVLLGPVFPALGQEDSATTRLDTVVVTVTRGEGRTVLGSAFAVTIVRPDMARPGQRHSSIDETLALVPGLSVNSRNNPSQDARLSVRGFGARSAFGVRGVRVLRDGMPLTLADGQTPLDYLGLESIGSVEVMRGSAAALYGNASGGVIDIRSAAPSVSPFYLEGRQWIEGDNTLRTGLGANGTAGKASYLVDVSHSRGDGARAHSRHRATTGLLRSGMPFGGTEYSVTVLALDNPLSENAGSLTREEMMSDPTMADPLSVRRNARKSVQQIQVGFSGARTSPAGGVSLSAFGGARSLDNPLSFSVVEVGRHSLGAAGRVHRTLRVLGTRHQLNIGADLQGQNDLRRNYIACADTVARREASANCPSPLSDRGIVTLDQREIVTSTGVYASDEIAVSRNVLITGAMRGDRVRFEVRDRLLSPSNPDDSGIRSLSAFSPGAGIVGRFAHSHSAYANISTAFETPTATELGNREAGTGGINTDLEPQRSRSVEGGIRGYRGAALRYDVALFHTRVRDELVPFEIANSNGRRYFRNAGRTLRRGAEIGGDATAGRAALTVSYTYSIFSFEEYAVGGTDFAGNTLPGIPRHRLQTAARIGRTRRFGILETEMAGFSYADDGNSVRVPGYFVAHMRAGLAVSGGARRLSITAGVRNIFNANYSASIVTNAARNRFFEPAQARSAYLGASIGGRVVK